MIGRGDKSKRERRKSAPIPAQEAPTTPIRKPTKEKVKRGRPKGALGKKSDPEGKAGEFKAPGGVATRRSTRTKHKPGTSRKKEQLENELRIERKREAEAYKMQEQEAAKKKKNEELLLEKQ